MKAVLLVTGLLAIFVMMPITLYLQYQILSRVNATELMWFLFWVNVPLYILLTVAGKIAEKATRS